MEESKSSYSHILKYTGLFGGIECLTILIGLIRTKCTAVLLGPQGVGLISLFTSTTTFASTSTNLGIPTSSVKNVSETFETGDNRQLSATIEMIRSWSLVTGLFGMLLCIVLSPLLNSITFSSGEHTIHFICLSPAIALSAVICGETAILKGTRNLKRLAKVSIYNVIGALVTSIPIYFLFGESGIVPSLVIIAAIQTILIISMSYKLYPLHISLSRECLGRGLPMVKLGIAFVVAGVMGSGANFAIRSYLNNVASLDVLGLYNAGYMITMVYAGMVFSAMESDYFPRLSAENYAPAERNLIVNRQTEVSLLIVSPMLVMLTTGMPLIMPLLYSSKFTPAIGMIQIMVLAMYVRAIKLPVAYISLSKGDSKTYLFIEGSYAFALVALTFVGFSLFGLKGAGAAVTAAGLAEYILLLVVTRRKYGYRVSRTTLACFFAQLAIGMVAFTIAYTHSETVCWIAGTVLTLMSLAVSLSVLRKKIPFINNVLSKITDRTRK